MATTWFFDASGTGRDCRVVSLAGVGGSNAMWERLNIAWNTALGELGIDTWHTTDYFRRKDRIKSAQFPVGLSNVIGQQVLEEFYCVSFAVAKDYVEALALGHPGAVPPIPKLLMNLCFRGLGVARDDAGYLARVEIIFDRNEPFLRHFKESWQDGRKDLRRERADGWPFQINEMRPGSSAEYPGLQIADLLSWTIRCRYEHGDKMVDPKIAKIMVLFMMAGRLRGGFIEETALRTLCIDRRAISFEHSYAFS
jgi:hypothetical protein